MGVDTVSLTALTEGEIRYNIVIDERYRELIRELLPHYSEGGGGANNSSGYQETDSSDTGSF